MTSDDAIAYSTDVPAQATSGGRPRRMARCLHGWPLGSRVDVPALLMMGLSNPVIVARVDRPEHGEQAPGADSGRADSPLSGADDRDRARP